MTSGQPLVQAVSPERTEIYTSKTVTGEVQYENTQHLIYDIPLKITEVFVGSGDSVRSGDVIMEVDSRELALELKKKELTVIQLRNQNDEISQLQLEIAEEDVALFKAKYPTDGKIRAGFAGTIYNINAANGETIPSNIVLASIYDENSPANVIFYLSEDDAEFFDEGDSAVLHFSETLNSGSKYATNMQVKKNSSISSKQFILKDVLYKYTVPITNEFLYHGQRIQLQIINKSAIYDTVIPSSALHRNIEDIYYVFTIKPRDSIWGEEYYTEIVNVELIYDNGVNAAISYIPLLWKEKIVVSSSRFLVPGEIVEFNIR